MVMPERAAKGHYAGSEYAASDGNGGGYGSSLRVL